MAALAPRPMDASVEPASKRMRVTPFTYADVVRRCSSMPLGRFAPNPLAMASGSELRDSQGALYTGTRVRLHGFSARPELNGQLGDIVSFHSGHMRWLVSLDNNSKKYILAGNLLPAPATAAASTTEAESSPDRGRSTVAPVILAAPYAVMAIAPAKTHAGGTGGLVPSVAASKPVTTLATSAANSHGGPGSAASSDGGAEPAQTSDISNVAPGAHAVMPVTTLATGVDSTTEESTQATPIAPSTNASISPRELLSGHWVSKQHQALRDVAKISGKTCADVSQLRSEVYQRCCIHQQQIQQYCQMRKPRNYEEQRARNITRQELVEMGQAVRSSMQRLCDAPIAPMLALEKKRAELVEQIDGDIDMLMDLRAQTVASCNEYSAQLAVDRRAAEASILSLAPGIEHVDKFMQCHTQEVQTEIASAQSLHQELQDKLQTEEALFIEANDCPSRNPHFAKVQEDLASLKQRCEEQASIDASHTALIQSWDSLLKSMPANQQMEAEPDCEPPRHSFWGRLKCSTRAAAATS